MQAPAETVEEQKVSEVAADEIVNPLEPVVEAPPAQAEMQEQEEDAPVDPALDANVDEPKRTEIEEIQPPTLLELMKQ